MLFSLSFYICSEIPHTGGTSSVSLATKIFLICRSLLPLIMAQVHNLESKLDLVHMQQGGRNPCSSSAERAGATAVAFLLPPPPPPFPPPPPLPPPPPPPPRVPRAASPLPVRLSRAAITSGELATWLRSGNIQSHRFKSLLWLFADWLFFNVSCTVLMDICSLSKLKFCKLACLSLGQVEASGSSGGRLN